MTENNDFSNDTFLSVETIAELWGMAVNITAGRVNWFVRNMPKSMADLVLLNTKGHVEKVHISLIGDGGFEV